MSSPISKQRGFTMLELFSVVVVSGVLAAASAPLIKDFQGSYAAAGVQQKFAESLAQARERAVGAGQAIFVCGSDDGKTCATNWAAGWLVYQGTQAKNPGEAVAAEDVIEHVRTSVSDFRLNVVDESQLSVSKIGFDNRGFNAAQQRFMALSCKPGGDMEHDAVFVERSGRVRIGKNSEAENISSKCPQA